MARNPRKLTSTFAGLKRIMKEQAAKEKAARKLLEYGVFVWRGDGRYSRADAVKIYKSEAAAEKFARANRDKNYVVRSLNYFSNSGAKKKGRRRNKTIIKAKTINHLDVSKVHNPRRKKKNPRADLARMVRDQIRLGHSWATASHYLKEAGLSPEMLREAKVRYSLESGAARPIAKRPSKKKVKKKRATAEDAVRLKARAREAYGPKVKLNPKRKANNRTIAKAGKAVTQVAKATIKATGGLLKGVGGALSNPRRKAKASKGRQRNVSRKSSLPESWQVKSLDWGGYAWQARSPFDSDVYKRDFPNLFELEWYLKDHYGATFAKKVLKDAKASKGEWKGPQAKSNPRRKPAKGRKRRNGSAAEAAREQFAGKVTGYKELYFPEGTPSELSTLGPLLLIETESGTIAPTSGGAYLCQSVKEKLYIGSTRNAPLFAGPAQNFGKIKRIEYTCAKPHLGEPEKVIWYHDFENPKPELRADGRGGLHIYGGSYTIKREGITG